MASEVCMPSAKVRSKEDLSPRVSPFAEQPLSGVRKLTRGARQAFGGCPAFLLGRFLAYSRGVGATSAEDTFSGSLLKQTWSVSWRVPPFGWF